MIDVSFLHKHLTKLDDDQRSLITSNSLLGNLPMEGGEVEQSRLLCNLAAAEEELAKREQEMKRKREYIFSSIIKKLCQPKNLYIFTGP